MLTIDSSASGTASLGPPTSPSRLAGCHCASLHTAPIVVVVSLTPSSSSLSSSYLRVGILCDELRELLLRERERQVGQIEQRVVGRQRLHGGGGRRGGGHGGGGRREGWKVAEGRVRVAGKKGATDGESAGRTERGQTKSDAESRGQMTR